MVAASDPAPPCFGIDMDPYEILGVPRGCPHEQVKEAFRARVRRSHPDRGGDEAAFIALCAAYREILDEPAPDAGPTGEATARGHRTATVSPETRADRETYVAWLQQVSGGRGRRRRLRWWDRNPRLAKACLLAAIGALGVLVISAAVALGTRAPIRGAGTARRPPATTRTRPAGPIPRAPDRAASTASPPG